MMRVVLFAGSISRLANILTCQHANINTDIDTSPMERPSERLGEYCVPTEQDAD